MLHICCSGRAFIIACLLFYPQNKKPFHRLINLTGLNNIPLLKQTQKVKEFDEKIHSFFHNETKEFFTNLSIAIISNLFLVLSIWAAIYSLSINLTFLEAIAVWSVNAIAAFIPIPAKIGVGEASQSGWFSVMKLGAASGFSLYLIIRARDILIAGTGLGVLFLKFKEAWKDSLQEIKKQYKSPK
ncbi:MAG: lysylphosphatidylglycerol synthase domain-containing protein [Candidatus Magasanikbacteria bacterium]